MKIVVSVCLLLMSLGANAAGYIVTDGEITQLYNTESNTKSFGMRVVGSGGDCEGKDIFFPLSHAGASGNDVDLHNRAYSTALTALSTGMKVDIYNYADDSCVYASFIRIKK